MESASHFSTRFYDRRNVKTPTEQFAAELCRAAGVAYKGIFPAFDNGKGKVHHAQILADNSHGSTFCVPLPGATVTLICAEFERSNRAWESAEARLKALVLSDEAQAACA